MRRVLRAAGWALLVLLLVPAVLVTLVRLTEPRVGLALQVEAFTPFAIPLYAVGFVAAVAAAATVWRRRRTLRSPATPLVAVTTLGLLLHCWWFAPLVTGGAPPAASDEPVTVMSANVLGGRGDARAVVEAVRERDVDILVLVEVTRMSVALLEQQGIEALLPHRAGRPGPDWHVTGTMVFARRPVAHVETVQTRADSLVVRVGDVSVLAVHPVPPWSANNWGADHAMLLAAAEEHRPDIVAGDFNATPDHAPMRAYGDLGYRDAVELTNGGFQPTWPTIANTGLLRLPGLLGPSVQIDHVLVAEDWTATSVEDHFLAGTDHKYVVASVARRSSRRG